MPREHPVVESKEIVDVVTSDGSSATCGGYDGTEEPARFTTGGKEKDVVHDPFVNIVPKILYAIGYEKDDDIDVDFDGIIIIIENNAEAQGVEIWRRDKLNEDVFTFVGTASIEALQEYAKIYKQYVLKMLGTFNDNWLVFFDNNMNSAKSPTIYEYKIRLVQYPDSFDFELSDVLETESISVASLELNNYSEDSGSTVLEYISHKIYDNTDSDWIIAILNPINYFTDSQQNVVDALMKMQNIKIIRNQDDMINILRLLIMKYGIVSVIERMFKSMEWISPDFLKALIKALEKSFNALDTPVATTGFVDIATKSGFAETFRNAFKKKISTPPTVDISGIELPPVIR